jgi:hydroxymethylglutaryl-CoA lyase
MARERIEIVEVGPRDGFQAEPTFIPTPTKIEVVDALFDAGIERMEVTSFVSPRAVPQLADAAEVLAGIRRGPNRVAAALVPNMKGAERAAAAGVDAMVLVVSTSESHNRSNVNRSIAESLSGFRDVVAFARERSIAVHAGMAVVFGCPFEGDVPERNLELIAGTLQELGIRAASLGDTTGMATPPVVKRTVRFLRRVAPELSFALHLHNTRGIGLVNAVVGLEEGITSFEAALGGMGGCPFAPGATGNICTEDLAYLFEEMGLSTGVDLDALIRVARRLEEAVGHPLPGQVMHAGPRLDLHSLEGARRAVG